MTFIYSFLQKRKMHENQHGIIMVVIAYALSVLLLALGSDVFYNIKTSAAGTNADTQEETQEMLLQDTRDLQKEEYLSPAMQTKLMNPYQLEDISENNLSNAGFGTSDSGDTMTGSDTVWLFGSAMSTETFDNLMTEMNDYLGQTIQTSDQTVKEEKDAQKAQTAETTEKDSENAIKNFSVEVGASDTVITITEEEVTMLEKIVEAEAEGEDTVGKILIANVIFNRIVDEDFPDTVEKVIFQKSHGDYQFSPVDNGRYWSVDVSKDTEKAVQRALDGEDYSKGALYFVARKRTTSESVKWFDSNLKWLFKHGGHEFYK